ncbi:MAG TPA: hypothetical protein VJX74_18380 [Blastocatellia bacterium]|nr:hypothetical protein [Blastocatellia bacterium]
MLRRQVIAAVIVLLISFTAYGQNSKQSMKGYELYSWKVKGRWHYSIHAGTNRAKSYDEITSSGTERIGIEAIKDELKKIPKGEEVFWRSAAHPGIEKPRAKGSPILELPSRKRIKEIRAYCNKLGIKLKLV